MNKRFAVITLLAVVWSGVADPMALGQEPALRITNTSQVGGALSLAWSDLGPNTAYTVQARDGLDAGLWLNVPATQPWPIQTRSWADARPMTAPMRFYRLRAAPRAERGKVLSTSLTATYTKSLLAFLLASMNVSMAPQNGVLLYKVVYETIDPWGGRTQASGLLVLPDTPAAAFPLVSYQHGTLLLKTDAPSANTFGEGLIAVLFAAAGYAVVEPDYLGLGDSPGLHPYHHARSEATACLDLLRATRAFCADHAVTLNGRLFLCGYSQGGHATMALHRELEAFHADEFTVTASAPMAGAYDLSGVTTDDFLSDRPMPNPYYFIYLLAAYQSVYHLADSLGDLLTPPYDTTLPPLLNGLNSGGTINAAMPAVPTQILRPELLAAFRADTNHPLRLALRDNDLYAWTPRAPVRLYHCSGDLDVVPANAQIAYDSFRSRGATQVTLVNPLPGADHGGCALPSMLGAKAWFDSLKQ
jgi:pimeloyl-ACP methyl ester carboxylesterase